MAAGGLRFSQFYNTAKCHSSRVSLLTGQYCIAAGDVKLTHAVTSAEVLRHGGYFTAMTGKWHLSGQPTDFGFDRYFGHLSGACNYFKGDGAFRLDGEAWKVPEDNFYTTIAQQKRIGLLPDGLMPSPRPEHIAGWSSLSEKRRTWEAKRMTALAEGSPVLAAPLPDEFVIHRSGQSSRAGMELVPDGLGAFTAAIAASFPGHTPSLPGEFVAASVSITVPKTGPADLSFRFADSFTGPTARYHFAEVLVGKVILFESDVAGGASD